VTVISNGFGGSKRLKKLSLAFNMLKEVPDSFGQLESLKTLDLSSNQLSSLPSSFSQLESLVQLDLSSNQFVEIPGILANLKALKILLMKDNRLNRISEEILRDSSVDRLDVEGNPISSELNLLPGYDKVRSLSPYNYLVPRKKKRNNKQTVYIRFHFHDIVNISKEKFPEKFQVRCDT
jgi:Leucine-rich repeat (LRR) protein